MFLKSIWLQTHRAMKAINLTTVIEQSANEISHIEITSKTKINTALPVKGTVLQQILLWYHPKIPPAGQSLAEKFEWFKSIPGTKAEAKDTASHRPEIQTRSRDYSRKELLQFSDDAGHLLLSIIKANKRLQSELIRSKRERFRPVMSPLTGNPRSDLMRA